MGNNDDINRLDEQIKNLKTPGVKEDKDNSHEVIIDKKYEYDDQESTKKIDSIDDIEIQELEKTKELETIDNIENSISENEEQTSLETDFDKSNNVEASEELDKKESTNEVVEEIKAKNNNNKIVISIIIGILVFIILIFIIFVFKKNNDTNTSKVDKNTTFTKSEQKEIIDGYGDALKGIIGVYYNNQNVLLEYDDAIKLVNYDYKVKCSEHEIYEDGNLYLNKCTINGIKTTYSYGEKQDKKEIKEAEGAIKVYVSRKGNIATLSEPKNLGDYDTYSFDIDGKYSDLTLLGSKSDYVFYTDDDYKIHMLNYKNGLKVFEYLNYISVLPIAFDGEYDQNYIAVNISDKWGIYNLSNNERVISNKYDSVTPLLYMGVSGPATQINSLAEGLIAVVNYGDVPSYGVIDYRDGHEVIKQEYKQMLKSGDYLFVTDIYGDNHLFDYSGVEYLDKFDTLYWAVDGKYVLVKDKEETKLVTIKGKEIYNYGEIEIGKINYGLAYKDGALFQFDNPNTSDPTSDDGCLEVIYSSGDKKGEIKTSYCGGIAKPILYLYPKKTTKVMISFEHPEYLQTTYPKFYDKWEVTAKSNGDLYDKNNKYYYGLYWDEAKVHSVDFSTGYYVTKNDAIKFLEEKLDYIGLSEREANEFIMYWLPILEKNEKSLVYFELTDERESYNKLNITPKPDSLLRLVIHIKKVDKQVEIPKQKLNKFQRKGFVAVEWGGTTY